MSTIDKLLKQAYSSWGDAGVLASTGRELHDRNRLSHAREVLERALELNPEHAQAWAYLSYCYMRSFQGEKGFELMRKGIEATDSDVMRSTLMGFSPDEEEGKALKAQLEKSDTPVARAGLLYGRAVAGEQDALAEMQTIAREHADNEHVRDFLMWALMGAKQKLPDLDLRQQGVPLADADIEARPEGVSGHWMKLQMLMAEKDWDSVLEATERGLKLFPDEETLTYFRGRAFKEKGDLDRAIQYFARAIGMKPSYAGARSAMGEAYEAQDKLELAEEAFREILTANPDYPGGPVSLAMFLARRARWEEAEKLFLEALPKLPAWHTSGLRKNPLAAPLLERPAIKAAMDDPSS